MKILFKENNYRQIFLDNNTCYLEKNIEGLEIILSEFNSGFKKELLYNLMQGYTNIFSITNINNNCFINVFFINESDNLIDNSLKIFKKIIFNLFSKNLNLEINGEKINLNELFSKQKIKNEFKKGLRLKNINSFRNIKNQIIKFQILPKYIIDKINDKYKLFEIYFNLKIKPFLYDKKIFINFPIKKNKITGKVFHKYRNFKLFLSNEEIATGINWGIVKKEKLKFDLPIISQLIINLNNFSKIKNDDEN